MRSFFFALVCAVATGLIGAAEPKLEPIFNGVDLTGWRAEKSAPFWRVEDGVLIGESVAGLTENYLLSEQSYGDFVLEFEVRWSGEIDSGIDMREPRIQLQLGVSRSLRRDMTGSFYVGPKEGYPESGQAKKAGEWMTPEGKWNKFRVEARGDLFSVWINDKLAVHYTDQRFAGPAPLGLQIHGGLKMKVEYRNIRAARL